MVTGVSSSLKLIQYDMKYSLTCDHLRSVKLLQYYCSELPFEFICDLLKWKHLSCTSAVPARFASLYQLKRHTLHSLSEKYGFINCVAGLKHTVTVTNYFASAVLCDT